MHAYCTHTCNQLRAADVGSEVKLSGWVHRVRDHGQLAFLDLRDHYGITQVVASTESGLFETLGKLKPESVVTVVGKVVARAKEAVNPNLPPAKSRSRSARCMWSRRRKPCRCKWPAMPSSPNRRA